MICVVLVSRLQVPSIQPLLRSDSRGQTRLLAKLAMRTPFELRWLAVLQEQTAVALALAVEPPPAAGDSSQPLPWSCQTSKFVVRILVSTIPQDVTSSAHVYQRAATKVPTTTD